MRQLILIYGVPGAGKTTIAKKLAQMGGYTFVDLALQPGFRVRPMGSIAAEGYLNNPSCVGLVVEGVLSRRQSRILFIRQICDICQKYSFFFTHILTFYLSVPSSVLTTRRNRTEQEYASMIELFEKGNQPFDNYDLQYSASKSPTDYATEILQIIGGDWVKR